MIQLYFYNNLRVSKETMFSLVSNLKIAALVLSCVSSSAGEHLRTHLRITCNLFNIMLQNRDSQLVPHYTIKAMTSLVQYLGSDDVVSIQIMSFWL